MIAQLLANKFAASLLVFSLLQGFGSPTLLCVAGSRMFFNLKEAAEHGVNIGTNWSSYSHSDIRFDEPQPSTEHSEYVTDASCVVTLRTKGAAFLRSVELQSEEVQVGVTEYVGSSFSMLISLKLTGIHRSRGEVSQEGGRSHYVDPFCTLPSN